MSDVHPPVCGPEDWYGPFPNLTLMFNRVTASALAFGVVWTVRAGLSTGWLLALLLTVAPAVVMYASKSYPDTSATGEPQDVAETQPPGLLNDPEKRRFMCNLQSGLEYGLLYAYFCSMATLAALVYIVRYAMR